MFNVLLVYYLNIFNILCFNNYKHISILFLSLSSNILKFYFILLKTV